MRLFLSFASLFSIFAIIHCASTKNPDGTGKVPETISATEEGFIGEDVLAAIGKGVSKEGLKTPEQKLGTAKESARMDARAKVIEFCRGIGDIGYRPVDNSVLAGSAIGKELAVSVRKAKIKKSECEPRDEQVACKVLLVVEKSGIKKDCELVRDEQAR